MDARLSPCALSAFAHTHVRRTIGLMRRWLDTVAICLVGHRTQPRQMPSTRTPLNLRFMLGRGSNNSLFRHHWNDSSFDSSNFFWKRRVVDSFPLLLLSFPVTKLAYPLPHQPSFSTTIRSCLFDFPSNSSSYRFFPSLESSNESVLRIAPLVNFWSGKLVNRK